MDTLNIIRYKYWNISSYIDMISSILTPLSLVISNQYVINILAELTGDIFQSCVMITQIAAKLSKEPKITK